MYIACPECNTKFAIKKEQIGESGRKVKCSKCSHIWHYDPKKEEPKSPAIKHEDVVNRPAQTKPAKGVNVPALRPKKIPSYLPWIPYLIIGFIIVVSIILFNTSLLNHSPLELRNMQITKDVDLGKLTVAYKVFNSSDKELKMPLVRVQLIDNNNNILKSRIDDHTHLMIAPNKSVQVKTEFSPVPESAENINIMIGNKLDFLLQ